MDDSLKASEAYVALGSNMGDREQLLATAIKEMHSHAQISVLRVSAIYETDP